METKSEKKLKETDIPGVIAPPLLIFLSGLLIGGLISWFFPIPFLPTVLGYAMGGILVVSGLGIIFVANLMMTKANTNIEPWKPTTALLSTGIYGKSRNPVYAALVMVYLGISFVINSFWLLPPLIPVLIVMHFGVILREERYLEGKFGDDYREYSGRVRRWI